MVNTNRSGDLLFPAVVIVFGIPFAIGAVVAIVSNVVGDIAAVVEIFCLVAINVVR